MFEAIMVVYREGRKEFAGYRLILRLLAALRFLLFPNTMLQFHSMKITNKLNSPTRTHDPLYFLVHNYYLSNRLTLRQRLQCAMSHHDYESRKYNLEYVRQVYKSDGVALWTHYVNNHHFVIRLNATNDNRHEGDLSVILTVDDVMLCRMSFCFLDAGILGLESEMTMLISRNQSYLGDHRSWFDQSFKQNAPQFFCLSAICGIATANGFDSVLAIKHDAQIAYDEAFETGFRNSYTALWEKFEAVEIDGHVYKMNVPLNVRPLQSLNRAHRNRARDRRKYWNDITESARSGVISYRAASETGTQFAKRRDPFAKIVARLGAKHADRPIFK